MSFWICVGIVNINEVLSSHRMEICILLVSGPSVFEHVQTQILSRHPSQISFLFNTQNRGNSVNIDNTMRPSAFQLAIVTLAGSIHAHPTTGLPLGLRQTNAQFEITSLSENLPVGPPYGTGNIATTLALTVSYPDPTGVSGMLSTTCSYTWPVGVLNGTDWTPCMDPALQWRLPAADYTSGTNFLVELFETLTASDE